LAKYKYQKSRSRGFNKTGFLFRNNIRRFSASAGAEANSGGNKMLLIGAGVALAAVGGTYHNLDGNGKHKSNINMNTRDITRECELNDGDCGGVTNQTKNKMPMQTAVITGASSGMGASFAQVLLRDNWNVSCTTNRTIRKRSDYPI
jgi:hypothetical protein